MERFARILLDAWRQVSQHVRVEEILPQVAPLLKERLPADLIGVVRVDLSRQVIQVAWAKSETIEPDADACLRSLDDKQLQDLLAWGRSGDLLRASRPNARIDIFRILRFADAGDMLAGPLFDDELGMLGAFVALSREPNVFNDDHEILVRELLKPMAVAIQNDRRVSEISTLREAAEADRESLLRRLGRNAILDDIIGVDGGLKGVMDRADLAAPSDVPVLILGETGAGKEVVARAIHQRSPRRDGPFLRVNCGAIPSELVDSELFGHEKGSFTGATSQRKGWFERADGGSLFLDEVAELPHAAQVRLLRVLQDGVFERVGGQQSLTVDVRVITATHPCLQERVADGRFRQDLWYRIAVFPIELPPLRDRPQDMEEMANHFARRAARKFGFHPLLVTPDDLAMLLRYAWPGNARELAAVMDRAVILGQGHRLEVTSALGMPMGPIRGGMNGAAQGRVQGGVPGTSQGGMPNGTPGTFPNGVSANGAANSATPQYAGVTSPQGDGAMTPSSAATPGGANGLPPAINDSTPQAASGASIASGDASSSMLLDDVIRAHIERVLAATNGKIEGPGGTAEALGVNPHTLRSRMNKLGIVWKHFRKTT